jgi:LysR family glycine cleavage system transcriptional activator
MARIRLPPLSALRAFESAARHMSFSRAADELSVTPGAVSHQIRALEEELGVALFRRLNRAIELTDAARLLLPGLSEAFRGIEETVGRVRAHTDTGVLTVTTSPSFAAKWLVLRLHRFQERHPEIDVRVSATEDLVAFGKGDVDLGIRYGTGHYPGLSIEKLFENEVFPVCSPGLLDGEHALTAPAALGHYALIHDQTVDKDPLVPTWSMWLKAAGVPGIDAEHGLRFNNSFLALEAAIAGRGVALANSTIAAGDLATRRLVRPFALGLPDRFSYWIVLPPGAIERRKIRIFRDWLRDEAGLPPQA